MTVAYRSTATATNPTGTGASQVTVNKPTGTADGDLMIAVTHGFTGDDMIAPTGWTLLGLRDDSTGLRSRAYYKVAASEGSSYVWDFQAFTGAIGVSVTSFSGAAGIDAWSVAVTSTTDPSVGTDVTPARDSLRYSVYCWRDTTDDTVTWTSGTETHDVAANDGATISRGQSGSYGTGLAPGGETLDASAANPTNSVTHGIHWTFAVADTAPAAEGWADTGFGIELELGDTWADITDRVLYEKGLDVTRGTSSEGGRVNPSTLNVKFKNGDSRFSPNVPEGAYFDHLRLGTRARTWAAHGDVAMFTEGQNGDRFRCPETDGVFIQGDLDVRVDAEPGTWRQQQVLAAQAYTFGSSLGNWVFYVDTSGYLHFAWGSALLTADVASTVQVPAVVRQSVRATIDVDNGASGWTVAFYTSGSMTGSWVQLGDAVTGSGTTSIGAGLFPIPLTVGAMEAGIVAGRTYFPDYSPFSGRIYEVMLKDGIDGTTVANPVFTEQVTGTHVFTDDQGNVWSGIGSAVCSNRRYRFHGELSSAPPIADSTGNYRAVDATFSGPLRRAQQNNRPLESALKRYYTSASGIYTTATGAGLEGPFFPVGYWPLEDAEGAQQAASGLPGGRPGQVFGTVQFGQYDEFPSSDPIVQFKSGSRILLTVPTEGYQRGSYSVEFIMAAPDGITNGSNILAIDSDGAVERLELSYPGTNQLQLTAYGLDSNYNLQQIATTGALAVGVVGRLLHVAIVRTASGVQLYSRLITDDSWTLQGNESLPGWVPNTDQIKAISLNSGGGMNDVYLGHVAVFDGTETVNGAEYALGPAYRRMYPGDAFNGEAAGDRVERLAAEQGLKFLAVGGHAANKSTTVMSNGLNGERMGRQDAQAFVSALEQCAASDMGMLVEPREFFGIGYRTRQSLYNQPAVLTLDYANAELSGELRPEFDDLKLRNHVTVSRAGGSSFTYEETTGARGTAAIGEYPDAVTLSLEEDAQTRNAAGWSVRLGTVNEYRFPSVNLEMANPRIAADNDLILGLLRLDVGSRIVVENPPEWLPPEQIDQIVVGYREVKDQFEHRFVVYTVPAAPYRVGVVGVNTPRVNTAGCTLAEDLDTTETSVDVVTAAGSFRWVDSATYPDDFPFDVVIGGERMTVTACSGTTASQTFTVTRSVNGVVKTHTTGESVSLAEPTFVAW
ncbi:hypothetical protein ACPCI0_29110 [Streptomyces griseoincarnatus]